MDKTINIEVKKLIELRDGLLDEAAHALNTQTCVYKMGQYDIINAIIMGVRKELN